jgi:hypothetical protein
MALDAAQRRELARMVNDTLDNQFAFFARPLILTSLDRAGRGIPEWLRSKTIGEVLDAYRDLRESKRIA